MERQAPTDGRIAIVNGEGKRSRRRACRPWRWALFLAALFVAPDRNASAAPAPSPAPYSLPWQLRSAGAATVLRLDTAIASRENAESRSGSTIATMILGSVRVGRNLAPFLRLGLVHDSPPEGKGGLSFVNPALGITYARAIGSGFRLATSLSATLPVGMGGGNDPDPETASTTASGVLARSAMDNAMFAVNDLTVFPGLDLAYVNHRVTVQLEATVLQLTRVRGSELQKDSSKTNFTSGLHVGAFPTRRISVGAELRHQRWLSTPSFVRSDPTGSRRQTSSFAIGARYHASLGNGKWARPGIAYVRGLDDPMESQEYRIVQVDLPVSF